MATPVPAIDELIEVAAHVRLADAVIRVERPSFEVGEYVMDPQQHDMRGHRADDCGAMGEVGETAVAAGEPVTQGRRARHDRAGAGLGARLGIRS